MSDKRCELCDSLEVVAVCEPPPESGEQPIWLCDRCVGMHNVECPWAPKHVRWLGRCAVSERLTEDEVMSFTQALTLLCPVGVLKLGFRLAADHAELEAEVAKLKAGLAMCAALPLENSGLRAELYRLRDLLRWRKTSEEPPPDDTLVLVEGWSGTVRVANSEHGPVPTERSAWAGAWPHWRPLGPLPGGR